MAGVAVDGTSSTAMLINPAGESVVPPLLYNKAVPSAMDEVGTRSKTLNPKP